MKDLRWPLVWLGAWLLLIGVVAWLSLSAPPPAPDVPQSDKWQHLLVYGALALVAVQVFRAGRPLLLALAALVAVGVVLEVAQGTLTSDRVMDVRDAVANTLGVALGGLSVRTPARDLLRAWVGPPPVAVE
ncbi:VanZ family protein [Nocardioides caeni]|uniref:VanZ family protein n=1 Tax=Nocardioides caeni TaxID=574700 RepID=A0A4S8N0R7_9ACTN|nr:VanZ family protein [Nocardioides caeni]THV09255.1 VanZ family protein [Nocardioides caeni]